MNNISSIYIHIYTPNVTLVIHTTRQCAKCIACSKTTAAATSAATSAAAPSYYCGSIMLRVERKELNNSLSRNNTNQTKNQDTAPLREGR